MGQIGDLEMKCDGDERGWDEFNMEIWQCNDERARPSRSIFILSVTSFSLPSFSCQVRNRSEEVRNGCAMEVRLPKMWESNASDNKATNVESAQVL